MGLNPPGADQTHELSKIQVVYDYRDLVIVKWLCKIRYAVVFRLKKV